MTESVYKPFLHRLLPKLLSIPHDWSNCIVKFATYQPHYKEKRRMTEFAYNFSLLRPSRKKISLLGALSNCFIIIIKPFYGMPEMDKFWFIIYYSYYEKKFISNLTRTFACVSWPSLITKKREPPRIILYLLSHLLQFTSLFFNLTLSEYTIMSKW